jgi:hypothetical protein
MENHEERHADERREILLLLLLGSFSLCVCIFSLPIFRLFFTSLRELIPKSRFITLKKRNDQLEKRPAVRIIVNRSRCKIADRSYFFLFLSSVVPLFWFRKKRKKKKKNRGVSVCVCVEPS